MSEHKPTLNADFRPMMVDQVLVFLSIVVLGLILGHAFSGDDS